MPKKVQNDELSNNRISSRKELSKNGDTTKKNTSRGRLVARVNRTRINKNNNHNTSKLIFDSDTQDKDQELPLSLDRINLKIIEELIGNGDIKSSEISAKLKIPLSTIQRRRTKIEKSILKKSYHMDLSLLGYRTAQIFIDVQKGKAREVGEMILEKYDRTVIRASTRINSSNNLCLDVVYNGSDKLHNLLEEIKSIPVANKVDWSEQVTVLGDNLTSIIRNTLADKLDHYQHQIPK
ncbi:MAG: Lrp/AsnC family transcriptional regulator [Candidatus Nitrosocosmicus sp.]|nr:Lrp/AsnC family transcriptional regulator [Candidatus Nitrosocosmicus sp.]